MWNCFGDDRAGISMGHGRGGNLAKKGSAGSGRRINLWVFWAGILSICANLISKKFIVRAKICARYNFSPSREIHNVCS